MKIELKEITVRDVAEGYQDSAEKGVTGYSGKLNIRPAFQREFVYGQKERDAVLDILPYCHTLARKQMRDISLVFLATNERKVIKNEE